MTAGRELDVLVAEKVFGWRLSKTENGFSVDFGDNLPRTVVDVNDFPRFSTDIAAAWEVVEKLKANGDGFDLEMETFSDTAGGHVRVIFREIDKQENASMAFAHTAPLAICLAALKAVGHE